MERGLICSTRLYACCVFCVVLSGCIIRVKIAVNQKFCFYLCVHHFLNAMQQNIAFGQRNRTIIYLYSAGIYPIMWWQEGWCERIFGVFCCWLFLFYYICSVNGPVESRWCFVCLFFFSSFGWIFVVDLSRPSPDPLLPNVCGLWNWFYLFEKRKAFIIYKFLMDLWVINAPFNVIYFIFFLLSFSCV